MYWVLYQTRGEEREQEKGEISPFPALLGGKETSGCNDRDPALTVGLCVDGGPGLHQQLERRGMSVGGGPVQGCPTVCGEKRGQKGESKCGGNS